MKQCLFTFCLIMSVSCFAATNSGVAPQQQRRVMQHFTHAILQHKQPPWGVSAFSMVAQCKQHAPITVFGGTYTKKGRRLINKNSIFQIGSITKSFVSVVILQLVEAHKLRLNEVIGRYFPSYPKWGKITVHQLLDMTSGIPDVGGGRHNIYMHFTAREYHGYVSPTKILNLVYKLPLDFKPGSQYAYSNSNYILLGLLIQKVTHHTAQDEIEKRIINKLQLLHTYYVKNTMATVPGIDVKALVHGYSFWPQGTTPYTFQVFGQDTFHFSLSPFSYAGAMISTPTDINKYIHALYTPGILLSAAQLNAFTTLISTKNGQTFVPEKSPGELGYGLGVFGEYNAHLKTMLYWYQGKTDGFEFVYMYNQQTQQYLTFGINTISNVINKKNSFRLFYELSALCVEQ